MNVPRTAPTPGDSDRETPDIAAETTAVYLSATDARAAEMLTDLAGLYEDRYGPGARAEMNRYSADLFDPPLGAFLLLMLDDLAVAGGAFMPHSAGTVEFKRIWTHRQHRRRGLSRRVLRELEAEAARRGYRRVVLTTGPRQPEAIALYRNAGYTRLLDVATPTEAVDLLTFEKWLPESAN
ncbi:hypothetical protein BKD30_04250 [Tersicoccus phoenicis]|uniref:N-acetyltransferase domain-containing protein n=1 Tax=Tersicoccus phoenicis TaxID=554083 RepID=A0A1R1LHF0_9MICC|nr:GNAT family N-acetyltransferase [Tersicoccus phoenicis]OMH26965.1 hypothetical protein BKD30_04250 [Tersicoccus phoenicis]